MHHTFVEEVVVGFGEVDAKGRDDALQNEGFCLF